MALSLTALQKILEQLAPLHHAESWDNVGLLIDPRQVKARQGAGAGVFAEYNVDNILLTIDATPAVLDELSALPNALLVAYHPPLFHAIKRISAQTEPLLMQALQTGVPVYSPHTALDCVPGGVNDWLASAVGEGLVQAVVPHRVTPKDDAESPTCGVGRRITLAQPTALSEIVYRVKAHLGVGHLRLATAARHCSVQVSPGQNSPGQPVGDSIRTVVVAAGSGSSIFSSGPVADLYFTGECGHHTVLDCLRRGASVLLAEHTTTERGYLPIFRERILQKTGGQVKVSLSRADSEPLQPV